jgi:hypothetical protein
MSQRTIVLRLFALPILLAVAAAFGWPAPEAQAQQTERSFRIKPGTFDSYRVPGRGGGYSMTLSDVWGLPEMPPAPRDFGPHFDFPPESLNGPPLHDPYPN